MSLSIDLSLEKGHFNLDVHLSLPSSGVTAVFGPSGAGKTTLLRSIAGFEKPKGSIILNDKNLLNTKSNINIATHNRNIAYVFQEPSLFSHLTVIENITFATKFNKKIKTNFCLESLIEPLQLKSLLQRSTIKLSGGERQRVAIAQALYTNPKILLMDEPLSALDPKSRQDIITVLQKIFKELKIPTLYVSHSLKDLAILSDHILFMNSGKVANFGVTNKLIIGKDNPMVHEPNACFVVDTHVSHIEHELDLAHLEFSGGTFQIPSKNCINGQPYRLVLSAKDVSLSLNDPKESSCLNIFKATVMDHFPSGRSQQTVLLDLCGTHFVSKISRKSVQTLNLRVGLSLYIQIKASAIS